MAKLTLSNYRKIWRLVRAARRHNRMADECFEEALYTLDEVRKDPGNDDVRDLLMDAVFNDRRLQDVFEAAGVRVKLDPPSLKPDV